VAARQASAAGLIALLLAGCDDPDAGAGPRQTGVTDATLLAAHADSTGWEINGHGYDNTRFAPASQINAGNVAQLQPAWRHVYWQGDSALGAKAKGRLEVATPVVADGVIYYTASPNIALAVDARTGRELWRYVHKVAKKTALCCSMVNRGVALYRDRVFMATVDARLVALNSRNGRVVWNRKVADPADGYSHTIAPLVVQGLVIIGASGGEFGARGFVDAYDVERGQRRWRFWTVPAPEEGGWWGRWSARTPDGDSLPRDLARERADSAKYADAWRRGGGGVWTTPAYDPESGLIFFGTGNPSPVVDGGSRPGDNLYTASLVALQAATGRLVWFYQVVPHDMWDFDAASAPILFSMPGGRDSVPVLAHASKVGWLYVLDRRTGRRVVRSEPLVPQRNLFAAPTREGTLSAPSGFGGTNWSPIAYSPRTGLVYAVAMLGEMTFVLDPSPYRGGGTRYMGGRMRPGPDTLESGVVHAVDPATGTIQWTARWPKPLHQSGVLATGGDLIFFGEPGGQLVALDARTGKQLWAHQVAASLQAPPISYVLDGRQYVAVASPEGLVTFALPQPPAASAPE
jgi:PQQ-dependent dehydrogenase (methanol/ethanol family)